MCETVPFVAYFATFSASLTIAPLTAGLMN